MWGIVIVAAILIYYFAWHKPQKRARIQAEKEAEIKSLESSEFVNHSMQILAFMMTCIKNGTGAIGPFCVNQEGRLLLNLKVRMDSLVFLVKNSNEKIGKLLDKSYGDLLIDRLDSILKEAKELDCRLEDIDHFEALQINYYQDPEDTYDEWIIFETKISIPTPANSHMAALERTVQNKYGNDSISVIY